MPARSEEDGAMDDEHREMTSDGEEHALNGSFKLDLGEELSEATLMYQTCSALNAAEKKSALVASHALAGNALLHSWWGDLLGPNQPFDASKCFVVCASI